jgi:hypothetical protein
MVMNPAYAARRLAQKASVALNSAPGEPRIFTKSHQGGWGRSWHFTKHSVNEESITGTITGHLTPLPRVGDEFHSEMTSGDIGCFIVKSIEYTVDPSDMFFAEVEMREYVK